jgi:peptidoglycan/xylan/chitin deacetylase (PgdA/CDA1 family)
MWLNFAMTGHILSRREFLKLSGAALASLAMRPLKPALDDSLASQALWKGSLRHPVAALTCDDCYLSTMLKALDEILAGHPEIKMTLFPVGETFASNEAKIPGLWKQFYANGHEFGYHSFSHINPGVQSSETVIADYDHWYEACSQVLDEAPRVRFARPPFGVVSQSFLDMCQARNLIPTMWSTGWGGPYESASSAIRKTSNGDIILMHTRPEDIANARKALDDEMVDSSIKLVTMTELYSAYLRDQQGFDQCDPGSTARLKTCPD